MQTLIDIEENQINKLLFYTHAKNGTEAINKTYIQLISAIENKRKKEGQLI
jgi:hypothetical protein